MNKKGIILTVLITLLVTVLMTISFITKENFDNPTSLYQVYLDGDKIGIIDSKEELYELINQEQTEIKTEYNVDQVYPPKGFQIIKQNTYNENLSTVSEIYDAIKDEKQFTIQGYVVTIKNKVDGGEPTYIYILDQKVFEDAIYNYIITFIGKERYEQYKTKTQPEIVGTGYIIERMEFEDEITIKETYINANEKIYTDADELTSFLLFGENTSRVEYTVEQGDSLESIAEKNQMNSKELILINNLQSEDTLLAVGETLNVATIDPVISLLYEELVTEDVEVQYEKIEEKDSSQYVGYTSVKQKGVNGINRVTNRVQFVNGAQNPAVYLVGDPVVIRAVQNEITVKGSKKKPVSKDINNYKIEVDTSGGAWAWPTNSNYIITSGYGWRSGYYGGFHEGIDISGTGYGSPIYASLDGEVINAGWGGYAGSAAGINIVIQHSNGYCTVYAHLSKVYVKKGQMVSRKQVIGGMGHTGAATGTHLHFAVYTGVPYNGGKVFSPWQLWK